MIQAAGFKDVGMDHFSKVEDALYLALKSGGLHRNFMGYADRYTPLLLGLGVSSISDAWTGFAQNVKTVEEYHALIGEGKLPVVKGHLLTDLDTHIRQYILDMMCRGKVILKDNVKENEDILKRLQPMIADGLVTVTNNKVEITQVGKSFLRNVCMAFDVRLHETQERENLFSQAI